MPTNFIKTGFLLATLTAILIAMGALVGGETGLVVAFVISLVMSAFSLWKSDSMVLRMHGAREIDAASAPGLHTLVQDLSQRAGLPMPRVYVMQNPQPNAFATGRSPSRSAVAVSTGLMEMLTREEIAGVVAHELAHIKNRDTLTMTVAATIGGAISMFANMLQFGLLFGGNRSGGRVGWLGTLVTIIVAPMAAMMVQMAISRSREYQADRVGSEIVGNPLWLASALRKIGHYARQIRNPTAEQVPASAHLFIVNPLTGRGVDSLFSTHPNTENRIAELERLAAEWGMRDDAPADRDDGRDRRTDDNPRLRLPEDRRSGPWS
jgi:heat shock protein HtpX